MFADREEAGRKLGARLLRFKDQKPCILALPRGGVPVGLEVAKMLGAPLDLIIVRKLGAPWQPELAIGAIVDGDKPQLVLNRDIIAQLGITPEEIESAKKQQIAEIERRRAAYLAGRPRVAIEGRTAIIVDDGIATGATIRAAILATRAAHPMKIVLAVPVAPTDTIAALNREADEIVCLETHDDFAALSLYYMDFRQLEDEEMRALLARAPHAPPSTAFSQD
ncbi:MAG: phosphoribosyltransferase [Parvibaculum sedimenti]|uniref:phosphoribosyltransferase n=1 Tax=Parvibaculum sedimenti TaxID=2608632 RepID=UPI003BB6F58A